LLKWTNCVQFGSDYVMVFNLSTTVVYICNLINLTLLLIVSQQISLPFPYSNSVVQGRQICFDLSLCWWIVDSYCNGCNGKRHKSIHFCGETNCLFYIYLLLFCKQFWC